jgi:hypothetical protein
MVVLVSDLMTAVRDRADMQSGSYIGDSQLIYMINESAEGLYGSICQGNPDYNVQQVVITLTSNTYPLPSDFWKVRGIDYQCSSSTDWKEIHSEPSFHERNRGNTQTIEASYGYPVRRYIVMIPTLTITPQTLAPGIYRLSYVPRATALTDGYDQITDFLTINSWLAFIVADVAAKCLEIEESYEQAQILQGRCAVLLTKILAESASLDAGESQVIGRIRHDHGSNGMGGFGYGGF